MFNLNETQNKEPLDYWLLGSILVLIVVGLIMVASSSIAISEQKFNNPLHYFTRQIISVGLGVFAALLAFRIPLMIWEKYRIVLFLFGIVLLIATIVLGREIGGSTRWLPLGVMNFQTSEFVKLAVIIFMAGYLTRHANAVKENFEAIIRLFIPFGMMAMLLLMQPDFGSTFVIAVIIAGMLLIAGAAWRFFVFTVLPIATLLVIVVITSEYRMVRMTTFLDPWADAFGDGYQLIQALIASGRGEIFGVGVGESVQKLLYLPDAHTDFLFSIYAEEYGLLGVIFLAMLYLFILFRCFKIGRNAFYKADRFGGLIAYGVGIWIGLQVIINMGMNLGLLPTKGLTLPLMSYGGSSVLMILVALALVFRVDYETRRKNLKDDKVAK